MIPEERQFPEYGIEVCNGRYILEPCLTSIGMLRYLSEEDWGHMQVYLNPKNRDRIQSWGYEIKVHEEDSTTRHLLSLGATDAAPFKEGEYWPPESILDKIGEALDKAQTNSQRVADALRETDAD